MASLWFDTRAFKFQLKLDNTRDAYNTCNGALEKILRKQSRLRDSLFARILTDEPPDYSEETAAQIFLAETTASNIQTLRRSFLMSLYHHWEMSVVEWSRAAYDRRKAYAWLRDQGLRPDEGRLEDMRELMRFIKHGHNDARKRRPDLFAEASGEIEDLNISHQHMDEFFEAIRASGYQHPEPQRPE